MIELILNKNNLTICLIILSGNFLFCQTEISGKVYDPQSNIAKYVNILLYNNINNEMLKYTTSNSKGEYQFTIDTEGKYNIIASTLNSQSDTITFSTSNGNKIQKFNLKLISKPIELGEVEINSTPDIAIKKDTITINAENFSQGNENVVEELLAQMPGITVSSDGTIKVGNREVEKVMIDYDDFFESKYKILTKNLIASVIDKVEIIEHYQENGLLRGIKKSNKVALNLKLKEDQKTKLFGNVNFGGGLPEAYEISSNLISLKKKTKFYFLNNSNNAGINPTANKSLSLEDRIASNGLINFSRLQPINRLNSNNIIISEAQRTNISDQHFFSLNTIYNPSKNLKIKFNNSVLWDKSFFFRTELQNFIIGTNEVQNKEIEDITSKYRNYYSTFKIDWDISKSENLKIALDYESKTENTKGSFLLNNRKTQPDLVGNEYFINQNLDYTRRINGKSAFILNLKTRINSNDQKFNSENFPGETDIDNIDQIINNDFKFLEFSTTYLRKNGSNNLEVSLGYQHKKTTFYSLLETNINQLDQVQNNLDFNKNNFFLRPSYIFNFTDFSINTTLGLNYYDNYDSFEDNYQLFFSPKIEIDFKVNPNQNLIFSFNYNQKSSETDKLIKDFIIIDNQNLQRGNFKNFTPIQSQEFSLNYILGNWNDEFFVNTSLNYIKNFNFLSNITDVSQNIIRNEIALIDDRETFTGRVEINRYLEFLSSNIKFTGGVIRSQFRNIINDENYDIINNVNSVGFEFRSGFLGKFNFHSGTELNFNKIEGPFDRKFLDVNSFLNLNLTLNKFSFDLKNEYLYTEITNADRQYYFIDLFARYEIIENKLNLSFETYNLTNIKNVSTYRFTDVYESITNYRILPRVILFKIKYQL